MAMSVSIVLSLALCIGYASGLSCSELGLVCPGGNPTEFAYTIESSRVPSKDGSAYVWASSGTPITSLTSNITCVEYASHLVIYSSAIPTDNVGKFPFTENTDGNGRGDNPNTIQAQSLEWKIPRTPQIKTTEPDRVTGTNDQLPLGPIGFTVTGVPFFNPYNNQALDAVDPTSNGYEVMDLCYGHPTAQGMYHHHYIRSKAGCLFQDQQGKHSPKLGYAFDGIPIYGPLSWNGIKPTDLDNCNGRTDPTLGYIYHTTDVTHPYIIGCYRYQVIQQRFGGSFRGDYGVTSTGTRTVNTQCVAGPEGSSTGPTTATDNSTDAQSTASSQDGGTQVTSTSGSASLVSSLSGMLFMAAACLFSTVGFSVVSQ